MKKRECRLHWLGAMFSKGQWVFRSSMLLLAFFCPVILPITKIGMWKSLQLCIFPFSSFILFHVFWSFAIKNSQYLRLLHILDELTLMRCLFDLCYFSLSWSPCFLLHSSVLFFVVRFYFFSIFPFNFFYIYFAMSNF